MLSAGKISCCILTEINPEFWSRPTRQKQILAGLLVTKIYKNRIMKISLFNYYMLGYISPITTSLPHIYRRNSCPTHIFKPTHQTWLQTLSHPGIFPTNLPLISQKSLPELSATTIKSLMKSLRFPKLSNKEIHFTSNSFHEQTSLRNTIFSALISGVKHLLIHNWFKKCCW